MTQVAGDDPKTGQTLLLQSLDPIKKSLDCLELITHQVLHLSSDAKKSFTEMDKH
jgi:hypothetical protein